MLIIDPNKRITVENALKHKFFHLLEELDSPSPTINSFSENDIENDGIIELPQFSSN